MIDYLCIEAIIKPPLPFTFGQKEPFEWLGIDFVPRYNKEVFITSYSGNYGGLHITILPYNRIRVENSLHKFHKGNNYSDFSHSEICNAIDELYDKFNISAECWEIKKLEFGFNIQVPQAAKNYVPLFLSYKEKKFHKVMNSNTLFEVKCFLTEYTIKAYDKTMQVWKQDNIKTNIDILRLEVCYNRKRKLPKGITTLEDLKSQEGIKFLYEDFENIIKKVVIREEYSLNDSSSEERQLFFASLNPEFWEVEKALNKKEEKALKAKIKILRERYSRKEVKQFLLKSLRNKYIFLFCS